MNKGGISRDLFIASIVTTVTVIVWAMIDLFLTFKQASVSPVLKKQMETLNPKLDLTILDDLEKKSGFGFSNTTQTQFKEPSIKIESPESGTSSGTQTGTSP